jgi:hypothetical protein
VVVGGKERVVVMEFTSVVFSTDIGPLSVLSTLCLVLWLEDAVAFLLLDDSRIVVPFYKVKTKKKKLIIS